MSTPTDQQRIRGDLRRAMRNEGDGAAARLALRCAIDVAGLPCVMDAATALLPLPDSEALALAKARLMAVETTLRNVGAPTHDAHGARLNANGMLVDWLAGRRSEGWTGSDPMAAAREGDGALPPLLGASEAADVLGMKATNLKRLSPPLPVAAVISGRIPVYLERDVLAAKARRDARGGQTYSTVGQER